MGQLCDLLGRKLIFLVGMGTFAIFVLLVGFSQNPFWMDIVLGVIGISCAMVVPPAGGILGAAYGKPSKRKNLAFSAFSAGNPLGFVLGSITCGVATRLFNVRNSLFHPAPSNMQTIVIFERSPVLLDWPGTPLALALEAPPIYSSDIYPVNSGALHSISSLCYGPSFSCTPSGPSPTWRLSTAEWP